MIRCLSCSAETANGLALCDLCRRKVSTDLVYLPVYFRNLARWRPGRAGSRQVPGSRVLYDGEPRTGDRVTRRLDEASNALVTWVRVLTEARPELLAIRPVEAAFGDLAATDLTEAEIMGWLCHGLERHLTSIATTEWCGEFVREVGDHEERLRRLTETAVPGWYAGSCRQPVGFDDEGAVLRCETPTYVMPGLTWVTCGGCGATTYARDHLDIVLDEARGWVARPKSIAEALVALVDTEQSVPRLHDRIRKWQSLGWLEPVRRYDADGDPVGPKRYRLGEVLDLALRETHRSTRHSRKALA